MAARNEIVQRLDDPLGLRIKIIVPVRALSLSLSPSLAYPFF